MGQAACFVPVSSCAVEKARRARPLRQKVRVNGGLFGNGPAPTSAEVPPYVGSMQFCVGDLAVCRGRPIPEQARLPVAFVPARCPGRGNLRWRLSRKFALSSNRAGTGPAPTHGRFAAFGRIHAVWSDLQSDHSEYRHLQCRNTMWQTCGLIPAKVDTSDTLGVDFFNLGVNFLYPNPLIISARCQRCQLFRRLAN